MMEDRVLNEVRRNRPAVGGSAGDDGMTIVELMIALAVVMIVFAGLAATMVASFTSIRNNEARVRAVALASELVEEMAEIPYDRLGLLEDELDPTVEFEGEELVLLFGAEMKVVKHEQTINRDGRDYEVQRWVTWFEEDGGQDLKRIVAIVNWDVGGISQTVRSETLRAPDAEDLLDLEVSVEVANDGPYDEVELREPGSESEDPVHMKPRYNLSVTATMGVVPAAIELRFRDRDGEPDTKVGWTTDDVGESTQTWSIGKDDHQFRHGRHAFIVYATDGDGRVASATGTMRFYQNLAIDPHDDAEDATLVVLQDGSEAPIVDGQPLVNVDENGVLCGPVTVQSDVHGMTPGEATPTAVEGGTDDEVEGGLTLHLRREDDTTNEDADDWGWGNADPVVMRLLEGSAFGGTYIGELGLDYLPELDLENPPVNVTLRADRRAVNVEFKAFQELDVAAVQVLADCEDSS